MAVETNPEYLAGWAWDPNFDGYCHLDGRYVSREKIRKAGYDGATMKRKELIHWLEANGEGGRLVNGPAQQPHEVMVIARPEEAEKMAGKKDEVRLGKTDVMALNIESAAFKAGLKYALDAMMVVEDLEGLTTSLNKVLAERLEVKVGPF